MAYDTRAHAPYPARFAGQGRGARRCAGPRPRQIRARAHRIGPQAERRGYEAEVDFARELPHLLELCIKYADREMDLADACLVRMTELTRRCKIWTVDRADFSAYRRHGRQIVPCEFPPAHE